MTSAPIAPLPTSPGGTEQCWTAVLNGDTLRRLRHKSGLTQERLAAKAGLSPTTVARLERTPRSTCRSRTLARLAAAVGELPATLTADTTYVLAALDQAEMDFDPAGGFRYGGGRDLSQLEQRAKAGDDEATQ